MTRIITALALALAVTACSSNATRSSVPRRSNDVITREEILAAPVENAYDAVQRLRPMFLRPRSTASRTTALAVVFVDGVRRGDPEVLRTIATRSINEIRFLSAIDATTRYGMNVEGGVLQVTLTGQ